MKVVYQAFLQMYRSGRFGPRWKSIRVQLMSTGHLMRVQVKASVCCGGPPRLTVVPILLLTGADTLVCVAHDFGEMYIRVACTTGSALFCAVSMTERDEFISAIRSLVRSLARKSSATPSGGGVAANIEMPDEGTSLRVPSIALANGEGIRNDESLPAAQLNAKYNANVAPVVPPEVLVVEQLTMPREPDIISQGGYGTRHPAFKSIRNRITKALTDALPPSSTKAILVMDQVAARAIHSLFDDDTLLGFGYSAIEQLETKRSRLNVHAVYVLCPYFVAPAGGVGPEDLLSPASRRAFRLYARTPPTDVSDDGMVEMKAADADRSEAEDGRMESSHSRSDDDNSTPLPAGRNPRPSVRQIAPMLRDHRTEQRSSIEIFVRDFTARSLTGRHKYTSATLLFASEPDRVSLELLQSLCAEQEMRKWLTRSMLVNMDFLVLESQVLSLDLPHTLIPLYSPTPETLGVNQTSTMCVIVSRLVSVCAALNEYPYIRSSVNSAVAQNIANMFRKKFNSYVRDNPGYWYHGMNDPSHRATLFIASRAEDVVAPLMHQLSYQSLLYDSCEAKPFTSVPIRFEGAPGTDYLDLNESDPVWVAQRHKHVVQVLASIRAIEAGLPAIARSKDPNIQRKVQAIPKIVQENALIAKHLQLLQVCANRRSIEDLVEVENMLLSGVTSAGKPVTPAEMHKRLKSILSTGLDGADALRLMMIFTSSQGGLSPQEWSKLVDDRLSAMDKFALKNLKYLGVPLHRDGQPSTPDKTTRAEQISLAKSCQTAEDCQTRLRPKIAADVESMINGTLSLSDFPFDIAPPWADDKVPYDNASADVMPRAAATRPAAKPFRFLGWGRSEEKADVDAAAENDARFIRPRIIVFIVGGASLSEARAIYNLSEKYGIEIIIASTAWLDAATFLEDIAGLRNRS